MELVPCAVCRAACSLSLKSKKGCDENGRRRRNNESREPGIRNDVPGILGPEVHLVRPGRLSLPSFSLLFFLQQPNSQKLA